MIRFIRAFLFILLYFSVNTLVVSAPSQPPSPGAVPADGKTDGADQTLYDFEKHAVSVSYSFGIGMPSYFPELDYVLTTHILRVGTTIKPGHTFEGNFITSKDNGIKITSLGLAYRPYTSLDVIAAFGIFGMNYFKMSTYQTVGTKERPNAAPNMGLLAGGGVLIPLSDTFYARPSAEFYFQPGITLILSMGIETVF